MKKILILSTFLLFTLSLFPHKKPLHRIPVMPVKVAVNVADIECLAKNIYYEAPSEPYLGKLAVAIVTMNRVRHPDFPKTVCDVVYQKNSRGCQFSWTCGPKAAFNSKLYTQAKEIAVTVLTNNVNVISLENVLYFHNTKVTPNWTFARPVVRIGGHIFYELKT